MTMIAVISTSKLVSSSRLSSRVVALANNFKARKVSTLQSCFPAASVVTSVRTTGSVAITPAVIPIHSRRFFSSQDEQGSHADFSPKKKVVPTPEEALKLIDVSST